MIQNLTRRENIKEWAQFALDRLNSNHLSIRIEWNNRFTFRMGDARVKNGIGVVRLSSPLWERAGEKQQRQTVIHEVCHIVQRYRYGFGDAPHGRNWKNLMRECGVQPNRCHKVDRTGIKRQRGGRHVADCNCKVINVGPIQARRMMNGTQYRCKTCKAILKNLRLAGGVG